MIAKKGLREKVEETWRCKGSLNNRKRKKKIRGNEYISHNISDIIYVKTARKGFKHIEHLIVISLFALIREVLFLKS